jgi:hypothetical protein
MGYFARLVGGETKTQRREERVVVSCRDRLPATLLPGGILQRPSFIVLLYLYHRMAHEESNSVRDPIHAVAVL